MKHVESGIDIDVTFGGLLFEQAAIDNSKVHDIGGLLAAHPEADVASVRQWVSEFATAMSTSDMLDDFDKLVARSKSRP
jgi:hypothetical protein